MGYKVLVDELTVHRTVNRLVQPDGSVEYQNGLGETYFRDEVIPDDKVSEDIKEAIESGEGDLYDSVSQKLEVASGDEQLDTQRRLGVPFEGYDEMEEDDIIAAMRALPSGAIMRIKEYEEGRDDSRERIVTYNIGFGESTNDRQEGRISGDAQDTDENKAAARLTTRRVAEEGDGPTIPGEGITGTGDPQIPYGTMEEEDGEGQVAAAMSKGDIKGTAAKKKRRGRRDRQPEPPQGASPGESSIHSANE